MGAEGGWGIHRGRFDSIPIATPRLLGVPKRLLGVCPTSERL